MVLLGAIQPERVYIQLKLRITNLKKKKNNRFGLVIRNLGYSIYSENLHFKLEGFASQWMVEIEDDFFFLDVMNADWKYSA